VISASVLLFLQQILGTICIMLYLIIQSSVPIMSKVTPLADRHSLVQKLAAD